MAGKAEIVTKFHPYMIDTATRAEGEEYRAYNNRRWGSDGWTHQLRRSSRGTAGYNDWRWWPNTLKVSTTLFEKFRCSIL